MDLCNKNYDQNKQKYKKLLERKQRTSSPFSPGRSERVKNISKVSMQPSKTTVVKKEFGKPKFVEIRFLIVMESYEE